MSHDLIPAIAARLRDAERTLCPLAPFAHELGSANVAAAYAVQRANVDHWRASGRRLVGRKIGLTSKSVQQQLGVDQPDYGTLFADMEALHGDSIERSCLIAPRIEGEIAVILERDVTAPDATMADLIRAVAFVLPALEIVDSRIQDWRIGIVDTICDNGAASRFVLGLDPKRLHDVDLESCGMTLMRNGEVASVGAGSACLGHPLKALLWLARALAGAGEPLQAGHVVLTGALGPMVEAGPGDVFEAQIGGFSPVRLNVR